MPSPFPGMNPYLENPDVWEDFHDRFIVFVAGFLEVQVGPNYLVKIENRLYVHELAENRLLHATDWVQTQPDIQGLRVGYFGASTGGGAALVAAAERPEAVRAVVSRGGRPDLAGAALGRVRAATLLVVGGRDLPVIDMNQDALRQLHSESRLEIVPGATHLFEEPGALDQVAGLARDWLLRYLKSADRAERQHAAQRGTE